MKKFAVLLYAYALLAVPSLFADGLVKPTYVSIAQDVKNPNFIQMPGYPGPYFPKCSVRTGDVFRLKGYDPTKTQCLIFLGDYEIWVPVAAVSLVPPGNADYDEAAKLYAASLAREDKKLADAKKAAQADADRDVTVHVDDQQ